jgi:protein arginine kinase
LDRLERATGWDDALVFHLRDLEVPERQALGERQLISRDLAAGKRVSALYASPDEHIAVMINEEDHLRIQVITHGLALSESLTRAVELDRQLEAQISYAVSARHGYLSACPTNTGTGMRASVMLHLPALAETQDLRQVLRGLSKLHMTVRGLHGEGSEASGHFYQISNQRSLGQSEEDIVAHIQEAVARIIEYERLARAALLSRNRTRIEDRVWRALGLLTHARSVAYDELIDQLSWIRLGAALDL